MSGAAFIESNINFKKVIVICTLTSTGRWLNTWQDSLTDYKKYFTNHAMDTMESWENFFVDINRQCISEIKLLTSSDSRIELFVGTNAVDHSGFDVLDIQQIIPQPWYKLLGDLNLDGIGFDCDGDAVVSITFNINMAEQTVATDHSGLTMWENINYNYIVPTSSATKPGILIPALLIPAPPVPVLPVPVLPIPVIPEPIRLVPVLQYYQNPVSYTHLRAHETKANLVCRLLR